MKNNILIGITGGIGSGKSAVSDYLSGLGEYVIYSDEVAREVVLPGTPGNEALRREFGDCYFNTDGTLDRKKLARHVFGSKSGLEKLNSILHPLITDRIFSEAGTLEGRVFIEVPLLIQSGMHSRMDYVWLVTADREARIRRVMKRDEVDAAHVEQRMNNQLSDAEMAVFADEIIDNSGSPECLCGKIDELLKKAEYSRY
jgi:dephospho-CoA kinase